MVTQRNNIEILRFIKPLLLTIAFCLGLSNWATAANKDDTLTPDDEKAIKLTIETYRTAWLANDNKGVLKTFTHDAVLQPAHGTPAIVGIDAIEKYWFAPGGPPTVLTKLNITVDRVGGNRGLAFARGLDGVAWTVTEGGKVRHYSHPGTYLNVMKRMPDGSWKIHVHMWDDGPQRVD